MLGKRGEALQELMNFCVVIPAFLAMGFSLSFLGGVVDQGAQLFDPGYRRRYA
jgi:hypothetical protein